MTRPFVPIVKAITYTMTGDTDVLRLTERPIPVPGPGEVRVRVRVSGVNPTDWKVRVGSGPGQPTPFPEIVPNQDGAGTVDALGTDVDDLHIGQRVWLWEAGWQRADGTAQEYVVLPARQVVPLPDDASFDLGASLGIPALTAHRCLTMADGGPDRLAPGSLVGRTVLVAGGAGAVGHAAVQLARWAGAQVISTVSSAEKAALARAAGAAEVVNYRSEHAVESIRAVAPNGVDIVVEVAPVANAALDLAVLANNGVVAAYANDGNEASVPVRPAMVNNFRYQFVLVYTVPDWAKNNAVADVRAAVRAGELGVGAEAGLPLHRFSLERTADAHAAVRAGAVGKVLIDVG